MASPEGAKRAAESYVALVPPHAGAMLRVASALVGPTEAEDVVQEAAVRAWQSWGTLREPGSVRGWLLRITVNVCREWHRGGRGRLRAHTQAFSDEERPDLARLDSDLGTSDHTGALDLRAAVNALTEDLRVVVVLRYYAGMDATAIGTLLGLPAGTVRSRLHRAIDLLRVRLTPSGPTSRPPYRTSSRGGAQ